MFLKSLFEIILYSGNPLSVPTLTQPGEIRSTQPSPAQPAAEATHTSFSTHRAVPLTWSPLFRSITRFLVFSSGYTGYIRGYPVTHAVGTEIYSLVCRIWGSNSDSYVSIFWYIAPCSPYVNRRFEGTYHIHLQGRKSAKQETSGYQLQVGFLFVWFSTLKTAVIRSSEK
jgi:hypothetical protein